MRARALNVARGSRAQTARGGGHCRSRTRHVEDALPASAPLVYDKAGDEHYDVISAFIKSMRGSDPDAAVYWLARMLEAGEDPALHRPADGRSSPPRTSATPIRGAGRRRRRGRTRSSTSACPRAASPGAGGDLPRVAPPKSNAVILAHRRGARDVREHGALRPPKQLRDAHYPGARKLGHGEGYLYPHDDPRGFESTTSPRRSPARPTTTRRATRRSARSSLRGCACRARWRSARRQVAPYGSANRGSG